MFTDQQKGAVGNALKLLPYGQLVDKFLWIFRDINGILGGVLRF